jgi:hypothetical protein
MCAQPRQSCVRGFEEASTKLRTIKSHPRKQAVCITSLMRFCSAVCARSRLQDDSPAHIYLYTRAHVSLPLSLSLSLCVLTCIHEASRARSCSSFSRREPSQMRETLSRPSFRRGLELFLIGVRSPELVRFWDILGGGADTRTSRDLILIGARAAARFFLGPLYLLFFVSAAGEGSRSGISDNLIYARERELKLRQQFALQMTIEYLLSHLRLGTCVNARIFEIYKFKNHLLRSLGHTLRETKAARGHILTLY